MNVDHLATGQLRWAVKCYSRTLHRPIWVVLKYPYDDGVESMYLTAKKELGLRKKTRGTRWQIWPATFTPNDGTPQYDVMP